MSSYIPFGLRSLCVLVFSLCVAFAACDPQPTGSEPVGDAGPVKDAAEPSRGDQPASVPEPSPEPSPQEPLPQEVLPEPVVEVFADGGGEQEPTREPAAPDVLVEAPPETPPEQGTSVPKCTTEVFTHDKVKRTYILCHPDPLPKTALPVVLGFHGGGGNAAQWQKVLRWENHAAQNGYVFIYMQGCREGSADCSGVTGSHLWNVGKKGETTNVDDKGYALAVLKRLTDIHKLSIAARRIYATGHSLGGIFSYSLYCDLPNVFAAIGPISAPPSDATCQPHGNTSIFHIHGLKDVNVPFDTGCCSLLQQTRLSKQYIKACENLPRCFNPSNWWPPVRSGQHPFNNQEGLDAMATKGLGCSTTLTTPIQTKVITCKTYSSCKNNKVAQFCTLPAVDHSLRDLHTAIGIPAFLWKRFAALRR